MARALRILLVEDDREQASLFSSVLAMVGFEVDIAYNAETAVTRLGEGQFDLVLVDWDLPVMKGDALIILIKSEYPDVKTVLFSNHTDVNKAAESSGPDAWMRKSEGILRLRQIVGDLLQPA